MKICFISTMVSEPWGGSEELWKRAAFVLRNQGYEIYINVKEWSEKPVQIVQLENTGCIVERRKYYTQPSNLRKIADKMGILGGYNGYYDTKGYLKRIAPDLVVIGQGSNQDGIEWMETCIEIKQKYVTISQAVSESLWPDDIRAEKLGKGLKEAIMNYFISENNLKLTIKQTGNFYTNCKVVRNPFNVNYCSNPAYPVQNNFYSLACVGRVQPDAKGQDILLEVLAMDKWKSRPLKINIYGKGPNLNSLKKLAALWGLNNVVFHGFVSNVMEIWEQNHGLVLPSRYEGLPLAVVEASLCGRISIVTDIAGNHEVIKNGVTGFMAGAPNAMLFDEAMEAAWQKRDEWESMGALARQHIKMHIPEKPEEIFAGELISLL